MAPAKRKRNDRTSVDSGESRPSPHRPGNTNLGQHDRGPDMRDAGRRSSRGGQGGGGGGRGRGRRPSDDRNVRNNPNNLTISARATPTPRPMSPPAPRPTSATQTSTPTFEPLSPIPKRDPSPFDYFFLTQDRISSWDTSGRQWVIEAGVQARQDEDTMDVGSIFQELTRAVLDGRIDPTDGGNCVKEILGPATAATEALSDTFDAPTFFLDTLSMMCDAEEGPFNPVLRPFTVATGVSQIIMRQKLDAQLLQNLGLTRDTFIRVGIRQATHLLYRQSNYNLLREETEGYSKLVTELFTTSGSEPPSSELVEVAFERVKGLIGTFDLDVGRVLDITLDVFAAVLIKHFRFFIKLLRASSWWPRGGLGESEGLNGGLPTWALPSSPGWTSTLEEEERSKLQRVDRDNAFWKRARKVGLEAFFELGGRQVVDAESKDRIFSSKSHGDAEIDADRQWIEDTGTFPPSGNRVAAQLLGFKLRFYASAARDKDDVLPPNLIYLTALLIKIGFISLRDLYPHLWPLDEDMPAIRDAKLKELAEKEKMNRPGGGASNALMMAGALADDTLPNGGRSRETVSAKTDASAKSPNEAEDKEKVDEPADQKVQLLVCLLTIGAIPEALFILGRFPWIPEAYPEVLDLINRILHYSVRDVYESSRPTTTFEGPECVSKQVADFDQNGVPKGQVRLVQIPTRKQLRWPFPDKYDTNDNLSYRFYWDEWADNIPLCQSVDDIFTLCGTVLNYSGVNIGRDASLLSKLARIGSKSLTDDPSAHNLERWQDLLKRLLVPALSLTKSNTSVVNEVYDMLRFYPISIRYSIYAEWFEGQISRLPAMKVAFARAKLETMSTMKRISMTNLTEMARNLAKTAYASPGIVFSVALSQIEAYTNLTEVVVECAKYFTDLGYDVLVWSLMSSLGGKDRNRNNAEFALLPSRWLLALSRFAGKVCKRYSIMNLSPIIQYVNHQLYSGNSTDLVILKELIAQMAGVVPDTDFTDAQLAAMTGGEVLRRQTLINLQDKRYESTKTAKRLMRALTETKLAGPLLLSIAQHRQSAIYSIPDEDAHIKLLATMIDDTQLILFQYLDLLRSNLPVDEFDKHVPDIADLIKDFGLDPPLAFMIGRASIAYRMSKVPFPTSNGSIKTLEVSSAPSPTVDAEGDVGMGSNENSQINGGQSNTSQVEALNGNTKADDDVQMVDPKDSSPDPSSVLAADACYEIIEPIVSAVKKVLPQSSWNALSPDFYVTFWTSTLSDLSVPTNSYDMEITRLVKAQEALTKDRTDLTRQGMVRKEEAKKEMAEARESLFTEMSKKVQSFRAVKTRLLRRKSHWFENSVKADVVSDAFLEKCLIPRLLLSPSDADFCFKMIRFLHDNNTPYFRTLSLYGRIFRAHRLRSIIFTCTVREAENLGRFLRLALSDLAKWHTDARVYEKEAWGKGKNLPGFAKALNTDGTPKGFLDHGGEVGFKSILLSWHKNLNTALRECLEGTEWMHIRNAITVLKSVTDVFPAVDFMGNSFIKQLEVITTREKGVREDLSLTGNAVLVQLKKRSKQWVIVQAFGYNMSKSNGTARSTSQTRPSVTLKPTAPEFKPQSRASSLGILAPKPTEVEDGEVDDAKNPAAGSTTTAGQPASASTPGKLPEDQPATPSASSIVEPKKSEVLLRREQFLQRENAAAKLAHPQPHSNVPSRPENPRNLTPSSAPDRGPHNLPSRPEVSFPGRQQPDRRGHTDRRDGRDSRLSDSNRTDRPGDRPRDYPPGDRRGGEPNPRDFGRPSDRSGGSNHDRARLDPPRWTADSPRDNLERTALNNRMSENNGRLSRDNPMPPPRMNTASLDRGPTINPERLSQVAPERAEIIDPGRAALISSGNSSDVRSESPRRPREESRDRPAPRPLSPRRHASGRDHLDSRRDDRSGRNGPADGYPSSRGSMDEPAPPPAGPRGDRPTDRVGDRGDRSNFQQNQSQARPVDPEHGRLNSRQPLDPNFGRLNATTQDIPSGPRDRNPRSNRAAPTRRDGRVSSELPRPPTPEKQPPTGPSRHPRRSGSGQFDSIATTVANSLPTTPVAPSPSGSIHPDRLKHLGSQAQVTAPPPPPNPSAAPPMHPDRVNTFAPEIPVKSSPNHINSNHTRPPVPAVAAGPPSGPKASQSSPITPGGNSFAAPTGPASSNERNRGRRGERSGNQITAINTLIQQGGQQNAPERGHRGRGTVRAGGDTPISAPSTPVIPPPPPPPPPHGRPDIRDIGRDMVNSERVDLITGNATPNDDREKERGSRRERSGRHSRRSSRSQDRNRDPKRGAPEEDRASRSDHRDRRSDRSEGERERHQARSPHRDIAQGREMGGSVRESARDRERDSGRRDSGRERDPARDGHDGGWPGERGDRGPERGSSGRNSHNRGEVRGEERRDGRGREDGGRKRRSDGEGMMDRGHDKRPRRA
ncbi:THO complex subunit [Lachnellula suecica]|uniref:THO complex subunit 2 n=1 Tax=Lachnellula suecica TaxID=602035 RepID=A0A8T9CER3_9HELO|nr:THO complex subunit [Lachnellula suecica]